MPSSRKKETFLSRAIGRLEGDGSNLPLVEKGGEKGG